MVQIPLRRAHRLRAITLASPIKKLRPQPTERAPTAWHTNDEYKNAEASEEASASSAVANASENRILPIPTPRHWLHQSCSYKRVSSVGPFYDGLTAARRRAERFLGLLAARGSGCALRTSRVSCCLITLSSSSAPASLSSSIIPISGRICSWVSSRSCSGVWARTERVVAERRRLVMISPPCVRRPDNVASAAGFLFSGSMSPSITVECHNVIFRVVHVEQAAVMFHNDCSEI